MRNVSLQYPSGLRVVFEQHPGAERVAIAALVGAGGSDDPKGREGTAHFLEHLAFRSRPTGRLSMWDELDFAGVASAQSSTANATTTYDSTFYSGTTPKNRVASVLPLIASMLVQPLVGVDDQTFELERSVVRNEHMERDPHGGSVITAAVSIAVFGQGAPGARRVVGTTESINAITRADIEQFVAAHYRPEATTVVLVGDLEPEQIDAMVRASFPASWLISTGAPVKPRQLDRKPMELSRPAPLPPKPVTIDAAFTPRIIYAWLAPGTTEPGGAAMERFADAMRDEFKYVGKARDAEVEVQLIPGPVRSILQMWVRLKPGADADDVDAVFRAHGSFGDVTFSDWNNTTLSSLFREQNLQQHAETRARDIFATGSTKPPTLVGEDVRRAVAAFKDEMLTWDNARSIRVRTMVKSSLDLGELPARLEGPPRRLVVRPEMVQSVSLPPPLPEVKRFTLENGLQVVLSRRTPVPLVTVTLGLPAGSRHAKRGVSDLIGGLLVWNREWAESGMVPNPIVESRPDVTLIRLNHASWNLHPLLTTLARSQRPEVNFSPRWAPEDLLDVVEQELEKQREMDEDRLLHGRPSFPSLLPYVVAPHSALVNFPIEDAQSLTKADFMDFIEHAFRPNGAVLMIDGDHDLAETEQLVRQLFSGWEPSKMPLPPLRDVGILPAKQRKPTIVAGPRMITEVHLMCRLPPAKTLEQRGGHTLLAYALELYFEEDLRLNRGLTYGVSATTTDYRNEDNVLLLAATLDARADQEALSLFMERLHELEGAVWNEQLVDVARWRVAKRYMGTVATSPSVSRLFAQELASGASFEDTLALPLKLSSTSLKYVDEAWAACSDTLAMEVEGATLSIREVLEGLPHQELLKRAHD